MGDIGQKPTENDVRRDKKSRLMPFIYTNSTPCLLAFARFSEARITTLAY